MDPHHRTCWARRAGIKIECMNRFAVLVSELLRRTQRALRPAVAMDSNGYEEDDNQDLGSDSSHHDQSALRLDHVASQRELNYYRLILTWISPDNIIRQNDINAEDKKPPFQCITTKSLALRSIQHLYPPVHLISTKRADEAGTVPFSIALKVKYEGTPHQFNARVAP